MAKKNYTKAGARKAVSAVSRKLHKLFEDKHISPQKYVKLIEDMNRIFKSIK